MTVHRGEGQAFDEMGEIFVEAEQRRLAERLQRFGDCRDAPEIWRKAGLPESEHIAEITDDAFLVIQRIKGADHDAR